MFSSIERWLAHKLAAIPWPILMIMSAFMLIAPISPEPHLIQKFSGFVEGAGFNLVDIFDVFWHLFPTLVLVLKLAFQFKHPKKS